MCFNLPSKYFSDCDSDSDTMDLNWQEIFGMYLLKMEHETKRALKMMSDDIERKGLTLNQTLKDSLLQMTNARLSQAYEEFGLLMKLENQLSTECSEKEENHVETESGLKKMTTDLCDKSTSMQQTSDRSADANSSTANRCKSSQCDMFNGKPVELMERRLDSDNGPARPAQSAFTPTPSSPPPTEFSDEDILGAVGGDMVADNNKNRLHVASEIGLDETSDSCPSLFDCNKARNEEELRVLRNSYAEPRCNEPLNKGRNGFFESIVENVKSFEMRANRSAAHEPMNTASISANLPSVKHPHAATAPLLADYPNFPRFQHKPTPTNLLPILPESTPRVPEFSALLAASAASSMVPDSYMRRSYQLFPPPPPPRNHLLYNFLQQN